ASSKNKGPQIEPKYFTEDSAKEMEITNWIHYTEWEGWEKESEKEMSNTEYYEENKKLNNSPIKQERLQQVNESQLIDIDEVYLIDIPRWGDPVTDLEFEEEIGQETSIWENSSFTWNQAS
ncbi:11164_t:CDS:2, partial [Gigaspora rosea]